MNVAALFHWRRSDTSISSMLSCNPFCSCVSSYSSATRFATLAYRPIIPLTMNYVVSYTLSTRCYKNPKMTIYRFIFQAKRELRGNLKNLSLPGQLWTLHICWTELSPLHGSPPWAREIFTVLVLVLRPPSHDLLHAPITQSFHTQCTIPPVRAYTRMIRNVAKHNIS